jgi:tripartite-type tricarboxylate transporter receptor subunit TctC
MAQRDAGGHDHWTAMRAVLLAIALTLGAVGPGSAADYPNRPIHIVVPWPAGGPTDAVARVLAQEMSARLGQPIVIDNKAGATGAIGSDAVAKSEPDGYTIVVANTASHAILKVGNPRLPYDPLKDFKPIIEYGRYPVGVMVASAMPIRNLREFVAVSQATKDGLLIGTPGTGSASHIFGIQLAMATGAKITFVPYRGDAPARLDLLAGNIQGIASTPDFGMIADGKARLIGSAGDTRWPQTVDVPTFAEQGFPNLKSFILWGFAAPARTSDAVIRVLNDATNQALKTDKVKQVMIDNAYFVTGGAPERLWSGLAEQIAALDAIFKTANIKLE